MNEENVLEEGNPGGDATEIPEEKPVGLSARDAREVAVKAHRESTDGQKESVEPVRARGILSTGDPTDDGGRSQHGGGSAGLAVRLQPPSEFNAEEKADFEQLTPKQQEAQLRLHRSRQGAFADVQRSRAEIQRDREEIQQTKAMADALTPYLKATGVKEPAEVALKKAIAMWHQFETGDPKQSAAAYLEARGIPVPKELLEGIEKSVPNEEIVSVQRKLDSLESKLTEREQQERFQQSLQHWGSFSQIKNAAGGLRYPEIAGDSEAVIQNATRIGQLVGNYGETEVSKAFLTLVRSKNPNATQTDILDAAYRYLDLKVDDSTQAPSQQDPQKHIQRSNRAAMSKPGNGSGSLNGRAVKTFKTTREAREYALQVHREREGH
jgi:hypothetical protein